MKMPDTDDQALLAAIKTGDRDALAQLYDKHAASMLATAFRILRNQRDAEDLVHDVFLEAWRRAESFDESRGSVRAWLLLRTRSRAIDRLRTLTRAREHLMVSDELVEQSPAVDGDPVDEYERARARRAVERLSDVQRQVVELCYFKGMTCQEVSDDCGIPIGTVKSRLSAALARLRAELPAAAGV